ncbi:MAG: TIGR02186 family protein [Paracoccaceae bacterium]|nr:TIGR02186 family protein [Paracoccaceae bacterium]
MVRVVTFLISLMIANNAIAERLVAQLSKEEVAITANFDGSEIFIYGAIKHDVSDKIISPLEVVITVSGPTEKLYVRKKSKHALIWLNTETIEIDSAPSFYAVASTGNLKEIINNTENLKHKISIREVIRSIGNPATIKNPTDFTEGLIRIRNQNNLYQDLDNSISLTDETLFATTINLPSNLVEGEYTIRFLLARDGKVIDQLSTTIPVNKVGLERWIFDLSRQQPLIYGLLSLFIAIFAGWLASAVFRYIRI